MKFSFNAESYSALVWTPELGCIGPLLALDTETEMIKENEIPRFVIGQAYGGGEVVYLIQLHQLKAFMDAHNECLVVMHSAQFDISVIAAESGFDFDRMIRGQRLIDTSLLFRLNSLATTGAIPYRYSLETVAKELLGLNVEKNESIRLTFGQFRSGDAVDYDAMSTGHLEYAAIDAIVTFKCYQSLIGEIELLKPKLLLSHKIQLMGTVALTAISRRGIGFDLEAKKNLLRVLETEIKQLRIVLAAYGYFPGQKGVRKEGEEIIRKLGITLPRTDKNNISMKAEHLERYRDREPFIDAKLKFDEKLMLTTFISKIDQERVHTRFDPIVKTGRTSSSSPNMQNMPRDPRIRNLFVPKAGHIFIISDGLVA